MKTIPAFAVAAGDKKLRCRREAARCFVFVCSWLQHLKHSLLSLVPLQIYRCIHLNSVMFSSATRWVLKTTSTLAVINKVHWCIAIVCCDKLYQTVETVVLMTLDQSSNLNPNNYWLKIASFPQLWGSPSKYCHNVWYEKNYNDVATRWWKHFEDTFIRFDRKHERDRQADGRTDNARRQRPRLYIASRGNKKPHRHKMFACHLRIMEFIVLAVADIVRHLEVRDLCIVHWRASLARFSGYSGCASR